MKKKQVNKTKTGTATSTHCPESVDLSQFCFKLNNDRIYTSSFLTSPDVSDHSKTSLADIRYKISFPGH